MTKLRPYGMPIEWRNAALADRLEALVQHYCTGPYGQSQTVGETRNNTQSTLREARAELARMKDLDRAATRALTEAHKCIAAEEAKLARTREERDGLRKELRRTRVVNRMFRDHCRDAHAHLINEAEDNDNVARGVGYLDYLLERIKGNDAALAPKGTTP